ncbi:winged helix-turn-helix transcriptional regulator [Sediminitomix flava]|uniref:HxlR family transcriptional regulator n=1 Tax=Sediminitomix flava TaxID=379075 RepID=A0A315ZCT5_SEDFL|nr:helix-turn-helix domain-containing protein [Sediminitomix flava]PWJ42638.1 HxlR family transcriptional regulator [Sediminitomix flava]
MRSDCPISYALDFFGDKWTLLVIRDLIQGKKFYKDFLSSKEGIATNILSNRLKQLESNGVITSKVYEKLRTKKEYSLTEKGLDLIPIIVEMMVWSNKYQADLDIPEGFMEKVDQDREKVIAAIRSNLES